MNFNKPLSREEAILQNILGAQNVLSDPQSEIETILQAILNDTPYTEEGRSRIAWLLIAIKNNGTWDELPTLSRNEEILYSILNGSEYTKKPQSRIEELLIEWLHASPKGYEKTVTGNPIQITDALAQPVISLKAKLKPIQDLHGYDSPWVGGAGENLLNVDKRLTFTGVKTVDLGQTIPSGTTLHIKMKKFTYVKNPSSGDKTIYLRFNNSGGSDIGGSTVYKYDGTVTLNGDATQVMIYSNGYDYDASTEVGVIIEELEISKTEITSWSPYSNICPISGHTEMNVSVCGKNQISPNASDWEVSGSYRYYKNFAFNNDVWNLSFTDKDTSVSLSDVTFGFRSNYPQDTGQYNNVYKEGVMRDDKTNISEKDKITKCDTLTIYPKTEEVFNRLFARYNIQLEKGTTATTYEPYNGHTYTIPFTDSQGNPIEVYGGECNVVNGGEQPSTMVKVDLGDLSWNYNSSLGLFYASFTGYEKYSYNKMPNMMCEAFEPQKRQDVLSSVNGITLGNVGEYDNRILIRESSITDLTTFEQIVNGVHMVYELATPQTYQSAPQEVQLLLGNNTIWSDTDELELTYNGSNPENT